MSTNLRCITEHGLLYKYYRQKVDNLLAQGKTTGADQTPERVEFTKLNVQRMNRLDKVITIPEHIVAALQVISPPLTILLVGDAWCGDCSQIIPIVNKIADASHGRIELSIISRDDYPEFTAEFMARSIPKLFIINRENMEVMGTWGPRPKPAHEIMLKWKNSGSLVTKAEFEKELHLWYARDKGQEIIKELTELLTSIDTHSLNQLVTAY